MEEFVVEDAGCLLIDSSQLSEKDFELLASPFSQHDSSSKFTANKKKTHKVRVAVGLSRLPRPRDEAKLLAAVNDGNLENVTKLLEDGVNVNCVDDKKRSALHFACCKGNVPMLELLISFGIDLSLRDCNGNTALHLAACTSNIGIITLLLRSGADVKATDALGHTPINYAQSHLRILQRNSTSLSLDEFRTKIYDVVRLLQEYLTLVGDEDGLASMNDLGQKLLISDNHSDLDEIQTLLQTFTSMSIEKQRSS